MVTGGHEGEGELPEGTGDTAPDDIGTGRDETFRDLVRDFYAPRLVESSVEHRPESQEKQVAGETSRRRQPCPSARESRGECLGGKDVGMGSERAEGRVYEWEVRNDRVSFGSETRVGETAEKGKGGDLRRGNG